MNLDKKNNDILRQLREMQTGGKTGPVQTAFQSYLKNTPGSTPSDTLSGSAPVYDAIGNAAALEAAKRKTYGNNYAPSTNPKTHTTAKGYFDKEGYDEAKLAERAARIPQQKRGGSVKSKKK